MLLPAASGVPALQSSTGSPSPPAIGSIPAPPGQLGSRLGRLGRLDVHNVWMVVLLVVVVGRIADWAPGIAGRVPLVKIAFAIAALYATSMSAKYERVRVGSLPLGRLAIAFFVLSIASVTFSVFHAATLTASYGSVIYLVTFVMLVKTTRTLRDVERLMIGLAVAGSMVSVWDLIGFRGGAQASLEDTNANDLAYSIVTLLPIVLALRGRAWGARRLIVTVLALAMCLAVLLTSSRGGAIGLIVVLLAVSAFPLDLDKHGWLKRRSIPAIVLVLAFTAGLGTVGFGFLPHATQHRLLTLIHPGEDYNTDAADPASRRAIWKRHLLLALERPIGYGLGTSVAVDGMYGEHLGKWLTSHNSMIQVFLELGVLGLYLYLASYYVAWRDLGRISGARPRDGPTPEEAKAALYARALRVALLGNFAAGFFLSQAYSGALWMTLAVCCAFTRIEGLNRSSAGTQLAAAASHRLRRPRSRT